MGATTSQPSYTPQTGQWAGYAPSYGLGTQLGQGTAGQGIFPQLQQGIGGQAGTQGQGIGGQTGGQPQLGQGTTGQLGQLNITFPKQCLVNSLAQTNADVLDKNAVGNAIKSCMLVNGVPATQLAPSGQLNVAGIREGFNEPFVSQSADGSSVCFTYTGLFWLAVIIILIILFLRYRNQF